MGYTALYRKFRPMTFGEMVGQEAITRTLKNQIISDRVGHAYLFNGGRGTGKTSSAKILARAINCLNPKDGEPCNECEICKGALNGSLTDIVEMDAASNNSVEDIRAIREEVNFLPTKAKYRVYIIDEVHMLSPGAFNALLKTLEEPPEHVKFILATTEPQKLPATILSRCQRFDFKRISNEDIIKRLKIVCNESQIEITDGALKVISVLAEGAMRDALSILERCIQDGENKIDEDKIKDLVGIPKITYVHRIIKAILTYDIDEAVLSMNEILEQGKDLENFLWEMVKYAKDVLIYKSCQSADIYSEEEKNQMKELAGQVTKERMVHLIYELSSLQNDMKWSTQKTILFQAGMIKLCSNTTIVPTYSVQEQKQEQKQEQGQKQVSTSSVATEKSFANSEKVEKPKSFAKTAVTGSGDITKSWPKIVSDLKQNGKIVLYTNLINTTAVEMNDMTVGIEFPKGLTPFGKAVLEKPENIHEISNLVSMACGKEMQIKYIPKASNVQVKPSAEQDIQNLAKESDIPFNVIE